MKRSLLIRSGAIFALGLGLRLWIIHANPIVFGGDSILRLMNRDQILLSYQLPLLQSLIHLVSLCTDNLLAFRYLMAVIGSAAGVGFLFLAERVLHRENAFIAAALLATNPFLVELSIVPYQEVLSLACLFFTAALFLQSRTASASVFLGLACLTRYEAWAACPIAAFAYWEGKGRSWEAAGKALLLFGWAPLLWLAAHQGLSSTGTYVVEAAISSARLFRYAYLGWITLKNVPPPVWFLVLAGMVAIWRGRRWREGPVKALAIYTGLFLVAILFSAHGESPDPERFVSAREAHIPIAAVVLLAGFASVRHSRLLQAAALAGLLWDVWNAHAFVRRDTSAPALQLSYRLANHLDATVSARDQVILLTKPVQISMYLEKAGRAGGEEGLLSARRVLNSMDTSPPDFQRTVVHSKLPKQSFVSLASRVLAGYMEVDDWPRQVRWVARWSDFTPSNLAEETLNGRLDALASIKVLRAGELSVSVYDLKE